MKHYLFIFSILYIFCSYGQDAMITDRPTQSAAALVATKGQTLIEYGFIYEKAGEITNLTYGNFLIRMGLVNGAELRLSQNIQKTTFGEDGANDISGLSPITMGTKVRLIDEQGAWPQTSLIGQVTLANGASGFRPSRAIPEVRLNFSNTLSDFISLGYNIGMTFPEEVNQTFYTIVVGYSFLPGWTVFAEPYGFFYDGNSDQRFNTGIVYLVGDYFQLDVSAGLGLTEIAPDYFIGFGAAIGL